MTIDDRERANETLNELRKALDDFRTGVVQTHNETLAALDGIRDVVRHLADTRAPTNPSGAVELHGCRVTVWENGESTFRFANGAVLHVPGRFDRLDRYRHQVLEVAQRLAAHASGTGAVLQEDEVAYLTAWLTWRVGPEGWVPTAGSDGTVREYSPQNAYDDTVRSLAQAALALVRHGGSR